jgi:hypothetical protein
MKGTYASIGILVTSFSAKLHILHIQWNTDFEIFRKGYNIQKQIMKGSLMDTAARNEIFQNFFPHYQRLLR